MAEENLSLILTPESDFAIELPEEALQAVDEFKTEIAEVADESQEPAFNFEEFVNAKFGGRESAETLADLLNAEDPTETLMAILPPDQLETFAYRVVDNAATQDLLLADPAIRQAISEKLFDGISIEDIQDNILPYLELSADSFERQQEREAESIAANERVLDFQETFFVGPVDQTIAALGINASNVEAIQDALMLAQSKFLKANNAAYLQLQFTIEKYGRTDNTLLQEAILSNKWQAHLTKELQKLRPRSKAASVPSTRSTQESKSYDLGSNDWLSDFVKDFKNERIKRGL